MKYKCRKCQKEKKITKGTIGIFDDRIICKQAFCCGEYMKDTEEEEFNGFPTIHRNESNLSKYDKDKAFKKRKTE